MTESVSIDDDVLVEAREIAAAEGRSVGAVISELARRSLAPVGIRYDGDLPAFDVPASAPGVDLAELGDPAEPNGDRGVTADPRRPGSM